MVYTIVILFVAVFSFCGGIAYERAQEAPKVLAGPEGQEIYDRAIIGKMLDQKGFVGTYDE